MRCALMTAAVLWLAGSMPIGTMAADQPADPAADQPAGFRYSLFDGKMLAAWSVENGARAVVEDGLIRLQAGDGWLRSHHTYGDFRLHVEWKALKETGYDAGIYLRASRDGKPFPKSGYQVNLLEGREGHINNLPGAATSGLVKPGEWNSFDVTVRGETVSLAINGRHAYTVGGAAIPRGHVGVQVEVPKGGEFLLRNLWIEETGYRSLLDEDGLTHWEGVGGPASACWELDDGVLTCVKAKGPWLRSAEQHGDFNLRLEYRVTPGANSGVYVRVPENGLHHRDSADKPPAGFEVQILDDSAAKYRNLKAYQFSGSVYDIAGAAEHVGRPPGEWNTLEIDCRGQNVTTVHNGVEIVRVTPETHPLIELRKLEGYLGLQNHGVGVSFRNLRIGPAAPGDEPTPAR
jgi:hypothetical protein